jgi:hypothetical protein
MPLPSALKAIATRNAAIASAYRGWAKSLPPGPVSKLASSMAGQRLDFGKALDEISADRGLFEIEVEFDLDPADLPGAEAMLGIPQDPKTLLQKMAEAETVDYELLASIAGAVLPTSGAVAERLASEAASSRKRSMWAHDHLDLLSM